MRKIHGRGEKKNEKKVAGEKNEKKCGKGDGGRKRRKERENG